MAQDFTRLEKFYHKTLRPYGTIVKSKEYEDETGYYSEVVIEYDKVYYTVCMKNGEVTTIA